MANVKRGIFESFVRKGYPKGWFTWIEALTLTSALAVLLTKVQGGLEHVVLWSMFLLSFVFTYFIAIIGLADFAGDCLGGIRLPKCVAWAVALVVTFVATAAVIFAVTTVILRSITA